jgi:hypothetical protein
MNSSPSPSMPPRGTRQELPIQVLRDRPLPRFERDEVRRLAALFRKHPLPATRRRTA